MVSTFNQGLEELGAFESGKPSGDPGQYSVQNTLGFTGKYQFGEALLIDLGYYQADTYYGAGASTNLWQGTWTDKARQFSVQSIEDFKNSPEIQETAIRDAFQLNWEIIERTLGDSGKTVEDFIGKTVSYNDGGTEKTVTFTAFGMLAGAHLRGPYGLANLLLNGTVSVDEYGTSILRYVDEYAGYSVPTSITGGVNFTPTDNTPTPPVAQPPVAPPPVAPPVEPPTAPEPNDSLLGRDGVADSFEFTWNWGNQSSIRNFNPLEDEINLRNFWTDYTQFDISQNGQDTVINLGKLNNQKIVLEDVALSELTAKNITGVSGQSPLASDAIANPIL
ncbi:MAG: hypothetical protein ACFB16_07480 [Phormidesmis sp.]